jgi:hypothetical protein
VDVEDSVSGTCAGEALLGPALGEVHSSPPFFPASTDDIAAYIMMLTRTTEPNVNPETDSETMNAAA